MAHRIALLLVLAALMLSSPAAAQDAPPIPPPEVALPTEPPPMPAPPGRALTLTQAMELATRDAGDPRLAEIAVRRAEAAERTALASLLPQLTGTINYNRYDREVQFSGTVVRPENAYDLDLGVSEAFSLRAWNATRVTGQQTSAARMTAEDARRRARAAAARAWFAVLTARRNAEIARSQIAQAIRQDQAVAVRVEVGSALPLDRARSELAVLDGMQRVTAADQQLASQWDLLGQALAQDGPVDTTEGPAPEAGETLAHYVDRATGQRPDVRAANARIRVAELSVDDAWMRYAPTLQLSWTGIFRGPDTLISPAGGAWTAIASLVVPFYDGGARYAAMDDAHAQVDDAREREAVLRRSVRIEVRDAFRRAETAKRAIELATDSLSVAQANAARAELAFEAGAANGLELEDARRSLEQSQITLLVRRLDRALAVIDLLAAAGML